MIDIPRLKFKRDLYKTVKDWSLEKAYLCWDVALANKLQKGVPFEVHGACWEYEDNVRVYMDTQYGTQTYTSIHYTTIGMLSECPPKPKPDHPIVKFYKDEGWKDDADCPYWFNIIFRWEHFQLEEVHDYIQWYFPTEQMSQYNSHAPVLTPEVVDAFKTNLSIRVKLLNVFDRMMKWYGLFGYAPNYSHWMNVDNHNYLRLTRIITSMDALGFEHEAKTLQMELLDLADTYTDKISAETKGYWIFAI